MPSRVAAITSFIVFAVCLIAGSDNTFAAAVGRALTAMMGTLAIGLIVGWMGEKMIDENVQQHMKPAAQPALDAQNEGGTTDNKGAKSAGKKVEGKVAKRGR
jgi:hypothetical protein